MSSLNSFVPYFIEHGERWVAAQREHHRPSGRPLIKREWKSLAPFFTANTLETVVVREVPKIQNPDFYRELTASGQPIPLDFTQMTAITFIDTVVVAKELLNPGWKPWLYLLFHECVHVCQYRHLGLPSFIAQYVKGWAANGFTYRAIPLEAQAYALQDRYEKGGEIFSVENAIEAELGKT
ncbi:MAG: hypothetical protein WD775_08875 [Burkholderiales bacterium]